MRPNRSIPNAAVIPELAYVNVPEAAKWLCEHFGFQERLRIADHRIQLNVGEGAVVVTQLESAAGEVDLAHSVLVRVENIDAHYAKVVSKGVRIVRPIKSHPFGERQYTAQDFGGHVWTFSQTLDDIDPASWVEYCRRFLPGFQTLKRTTIVLHKHRRWRVAIVTNGDSRTPLLQYGVR